MSKVRRKDPKLDVKSRTMREVICMREVVSDYVVKCLDYFTD
jgi:hypothetical protein